MKIGVLTFHRCINYGSYWQARCLAEGLRTAGHDAVILDHASRRVDMAEWKCALGPVSASKSPRHGRAGYRRKILRFLRAFESLPLSPRFPMNDPARMPESDMVVVGSDEVWNLSHPWYGACPLFYGEGIHARLVAYAASIGNYLGPLPSRWTRCLRRFERIAVRDRLSREAIAEATSSEPGIVLDPCLQFPLHPGAPDHALPSSPYAVVYGHGFSETFAREVRHWALERALPLISIGYDNAWADRQLISAGPDEFAHLVAGAEAVATNFFHGCVFALRNRKPFVCEASWYRGNKLHCLMSDIGGEAHLMGPGATPHEYRHALDAPLAPAMLRSIDRRRLESHAYLAEALGSGQHAA